MNEIENIVKVTITRQTTVPSMKSFSEHLLADMFDANGMADAFDTDRRVKAYGSLSEIKAAGFPANGYIYRAASQQFSQSPHIGKVYVGYKSPSDVSWADALDAIKEQNDQWYGVSCSARGIEAQKEIAQWIQANEKLGILTSGDPAIINASSGDIAEWCKTRSLDRVAVFYHPGAALSDPLVDLLPPDDPVPEAAYFGKMLAKHPGSATWKFKGLQGVPTYALKAAQKSNIEQKNATWYMSVADVPMTGNGQAASGEYLDIIIGIDWLKSRIHNLVFTPFTTQDKVPFTDSGIQSVVACLRAALEEGVRYQILASHSISAPAAAEVPLSEKSKRNLPDVKFTAVLAGAVHSVAIDGVVTL
jgi:hypothetical protein